MLLERSIQYTVMSEPSKDELHGRDATLHDGDLNHVAAQPGSGEKAGVETHPAPGNTSINKDLEIKPSKTSSTVSLEQRSTHDVEKGLPADAISEKEPAVTDAEHDPNIVDWDGDADPENPLNWSARKKWYVNLMQCKHTMLTTNQVEHRSPISTYPPNATRIIVLRTRCTTRDAGFQFDF
jgi:hypothetical protein